MTAALMIGCGSSLPNTSNPTTPILNTPLVNTGEVRLNTEGILVYKVGTDTSKAANLSTMATTNMCSPVIIDPYQTIPQTPLMTKSTTYHMEFLVGFEGDTSGCDINLLTLETQGIGVALKPLTKMSSVGLPLGTAKFSNDTWNFIYYTATASGSDFNYTDKDTFVRFLYKGKRILDNDGNYPTPQYQIKEDPSAGGSTPAMAFVISRHPVDYPLKSYNRYDPKTLYNFGVESVHPYVQTIDPYMDKLIAMDSGLINKLKDATHDHLTEWYGKGFIQVPGDPRWYFDPYVAWNYVQNGSKKVGYFGQQLTPLSSDTDTPDISSQSAENTDLSSQSTSGVESLAAAPVCSATKTDCIKVGGILFTGMVDYSTMTKWSDWDRLDTTKTGWIHTAMKVQVGRPATEFIEAPGMLKRVRRVSLLDVLQGKDKFAFADVQMVDPQDVRRNKAVAWAIKQEGVWYSANVDMPPGNTKGQDYTYNRFYCTLLNWASWFHGASVDLRPVMMEGRYMDVGFTIMLLPNHLWSSTKIKNLSQVSGEDVKFVAKYSGLKTP